MLRLHVVRFVVESVVVQWSLSSEQYYSVVMDVVTYVELVVHNTHIPCCALQTPSTHHIISRHLNSSQLASFQL